MVGDDTWAAFDTVVTLDRKTRRIEPGSFPLAHGVPGRVGRLRGYGNAIVPQVAAQFIKAAVIQ
jgi:DNA (cytosine-5)-methyltransferase 1